MNIEKVVQTLDTITDEKQPRTVMYIAEQCDGVCKDCIKNDGKIFQINDPSLPLLPVHPNCRCKYVSTLNTAYDVSDFVEKYRIIQSLQKVHEIPEGATYDFAEQILQSRKENATLRGQKIFFLFNGQYLLSSDGKLCIQAVSGKPIAVRHKQSCITPSGIISEITERKFDYSSERQGVPNTGGIPCGLYYIKATEERSASTSPWSHIVKSKSWGSYSWVLHPCKETDTRNRGNFFIHGGDEFGSGGCIDLRKEDERFKNYFSSTEASVIYILCPI
ncbi:MAG: DUF2778 domain-containing protein [Victivallaceae bacterium]|nr:DUF2778 domain-containing protein [Victivallaceae bacterium]